MLYSVLMSGVYNCPIERQVKAINLIKQGAIGVLLATMARASARW